MPVRIIAAACVVAALAGCAGSPDGPSSGFIASQGYDAYDRGDYRDAVTHFEAALAADPGNDFAVRGLAASRDGVLHFGDRRPVDRDDAVERAIYRVSRRGYEAYERGDLDEAGRQFRAVLEGAPGDRYALKGLEAVRRKEARRGAARRIVPASATRSAGAGTRKGGGAVSVDADD